MPIFMAIEKDLSADALVAGLTCKSFQAIIVVVI